MNKLYLMVAAAGALALYVVWQQHRVTQLTGELHSAQVQVHLHRTAAQTASIAANAIGQLHQIERMNDAKDDLDRNVSDGSVDFDGLW